MSRSGEAGGGGEAGDARERGGRSQASPWEWLTAAVSGLVVFGTIGFLLYVAVSTESSPPQIEIVQDTVIDTGHGTYVVEFHARNAGHSTAAGLVVEGELTSDTGTVEKAQVTIDYVPARAHRAAGLFFRHDPRRYMLELHPKGYDVP